MSSTATRVVHQYGRAARNLGGFIVAAWHSGCDTSDRRVGDHVRAVAGARTHQTRRFHWRCGFAQERTQD
jgi:hypothetical protein